MKPYADANFFTRLYLPLPESVAADRLAQNRATDFTLPITWLLRCEVVNALEQSVFISRSDGPRISREEASAAQAAFHEDIQSRQFFAPAELPLTEWWRTFEDLALRHTAKRGFRTYDILHVAAALCLGCDTFWTFERKSRDLARLEGLGTN
jgi:predicted nucleic acid-binding protein